MSFDLSDFSPEVTLSEWKIVKHALSGPFHDCLTNDLMLKLFLQDNPHALKGFISAIHFIDPDTIESVIVKNPFFLGRAVDDNVGILDLRLLLNSKEIVDIEMQVSSQIFFPERSLIYLCRSFDQLKRGEGYDQILPCIQVSILCNDMFARDDPRYTDAFSPNTRCWKRRP